MKKRLIVIGGGFLQIPLIETAINMGLHVIVFDMSQGAPGMKLADESVVMSTRDIDGCVREAKRIHEIRNIDGVITAATDASRAVAAIAGALDLPGIRFSDAQAASNKVLMRKRLKQAGVPIPDFRPVWSLRDARDAMDELNFPLVIKPADNMGARGVIKVRSREEIASAYKHAKKFSPTGEIILEEFMEGPELSVDALAFDGEFHITGIADRIIDREPYFIELGHNMPSSQNQSVLKEAEEVMFAAMKALGIDTGAGKGDLKITPDGVKVGEIAARLSGGFMSSHTFPLHSGINLLRAAIQIAMGERPDSLKPGQNKVCIERGILGMPGKILSVSGIEKMKQVPGIVDIFVMRNPGDILPSLTSNIDKCGHIIACGNTLEEAESSANQAMSLFEITVDDTYSIDWKKVEEIARQRFGSSICHVCKTCDGDNCASGVPGMGGVGNMNTFRDNSRALEEIKILPRYVRNSVQADSSIEFFGKKYSTPVFIAPMTGAVTNMNSAVSEYDLARYLLLGAKESGSLAFTGDGASPDRYKIVMKALEDADGQGILICKPREDTDEILKRFKLAEQMQITAVGMDIDAVSFKTMNLKNIPGISRNVTDLKKLRDSVKLPFILKGIMHPEDALSAMEAGVDAIVVSNHGGRVLDEMPGTARVLPDIIRVVDGKIPVLVDGGIRSGMDAFKMLSLGAFAVLTGRPMAIAAAGGELTGVKYLLSKYSDELLKTMSITGTETLEDITAEYILQNKHQSLRNI